MPNGETVPDVMTDEELAQYEHAFLSNKEAQRQGKMKQTTLFDGASETAPGE